MKFKNVQRPIIVRDKKGRFKRTYVWQQMRFLDFMEEINGTRWVVDFYNKESYKDEVYMFRNDVIELELEPEDIGYPF